MITARYLQEVKQCESMRKAILQWAHVQFRAVNHTLWLTTHFLERLAQRSMSPVRSHRAFDLALRALHKNWEQCKGKKTAIKSDSFVFIFDATQDGFIRGVTFWYSDKPAAAALQGRGDVLLEIPS